MNVKTIAKVAAVSLATIYVTNNFLANKPGFFANILKG